MLLSVIIPAYKKQGTIATDVTSIYKTLKKTRYKFEIIVIEDGRLDNTYEIFTTYLKDNPELSHHIKFYSYKENHGKGYALRYGMARANGDLILFIDAGMDINPNGISILVEHLQWYDADIVVASKRHPASKTYMPPMRRLYSWGYYFIVKLLFGLEVSDTQTGLKVFKRAVLEDVLPRLLVKEYAIDIELLAVAYSLGYCKIYEAPVELHLGFDSDSKWSADLPLFFDPQIRLMLLDTLAVFYRLRFLNYYSDDSFRSWTYDSDLDLHINTGDVSYISSHRTPLYQPKLSQELLDNSLRFSVLIPTRSVTSHLLEALTYLQQQSYTNFEVLVMLDSFKQVPVTDSRITFISTGSISPGEKRNIGIKKSTGDILVLLDDDAYPSQDWLLHASRILANPYIYALGGPGITPTNVGLFERASGFVLASVLTSGGTKFRHLKSKRRYVDDYPSFNFFFRKSAMDHINGLSTEFWPGEDTILCLDLVEFYKRPFVYDPAPFVYHHRRPQILPHLKQISRYALTRGHFAVNFPQTSLRLQYFIPTLFILGLLGGPVLAYFISYLWFVYVGVVLLYLGGLVYESTRAYLHTKSLLVAFLVPFGIFLTNMVYGLYIALGLISAPKLRLRTIGLNGDYIGG
ncbi:MAG: glycosyltransferase [Patescibacteria group bacterium]|uniref:Glycosyltransferase n=1 Tax=candidate division WWE3 bacterium TaxID=2053526 RepID=A0A955J1Z9_UNCKA|nr:glycosyltransferase [candidate division WWE3 bacterium]